MILAGVYNQLLRLPLRIVVMDSAATSGFVVVSDDFGVTWVKRTFSDVTGNPYMVYASGDTILITRNTTATTYCQFSVNAGVDFSNSGTSDSYISGGCVSWDGTKLAFIDSANGSVHRSLNSGANWAYSGVLYKAHQCMISDSGQYFICGPLTSYSTNDNKIWISTNTFSSFTQKTVWSGNYLTRAAFMSSSGQYMFVASSTGGMRIARSADYGANFSESLIYNGSNEPLNCIYGSSDGKYVYLYSINDDRLYFSSDYGANFELRNTISTQWMQTFAFAKFVSSTGQYLILPGTNGTSITLSRDFGKSYYRVTVPYVSSIKAMSIAF